MRREAFCQCYSHQSILLQMWHRTKTIQTDRLRAIPKGRVPCGTALDLILIYNQKSRSDTEIVEDGGNLFFRYCIGSV